MYLIRSVPIHLVHCYSEPLLMPDLQNHRAEEHCGGDRGQAQQVSHTQEDTRVHQIPPGNIDKQTQI